MPVLTVAAATKPFPGKAKLCDWFTNLASLKALHPKRSNLWLQIESPFCHAICSESASLLGMADRSEIRRGSPQEQSHDAKWTKLNQKHEKHQKPMPNKEESSPLQSMSETPSENCHSNKSEKVWKSVARYKKSFSAWFFQTGVHSRHDGTINMMSWLRFDYQAGFGWSLMGKQWIGSNNAWCLVTCLNFQSEQKVLKRSFSTFNFAFSSHACLSNHVLYFLFFLQIFTRNVLFDECPFGTPQPHSLCWFNLSRSRVSTPRESLKTERKTELQIPPTWLRSCEKWRPLKGFKAIQKINIDIVTSFWNFPKT